MTIKLGRRALIAAASAALLAGPVTAGGHQVVESIHFLIPGGAGGELIRCCRWVVQGASALADRRRILEAVPVAQPTG